MAGKFIELEAAAKMLGMSVDKLTELRQRGEIHGYRDGTSWKFKPEEVERVAEEFDITLKEAPSEEVPPDDAFEDLLEAASESAVLSAEKEQGGDAEDPASSTVIGKKKKAESSAADSELQLASDDGSDISLADEAAGDAQGGGSSDVLGDAELKPSAGSGTGDLELGSDALGSDALDEALELGDDEDLALGDDDDLVLGGSGIGSDVSLDAAGSGINLASPSDSGLSLEEEPLDITGSGAESLELGEDFEEDVISLDDEMGDPDEATQLKQDEDFLLSPSDDAADESDSGSQVIALEDSEAFDEDAATMLGPAEGGLVAEDDTLGDAPLVDFETAGAAQTMAAGPRVPELPEAPYSLLQVLSLLAITSILTLSGFLMVDVVRNMWSWNGTGPVGSSLMDLFIKVF